jgi:hypothetical protein
LAVFYRLPRHLARAGIELLLFEKSVEPGRVDPVIETLRDRYETAQKRLRELQVGSDPDVDETLLFVFEELKAVITDVPLRVAAVAEEDWNSRASEADTLRAETLRFRRAHLSSLNGDPGLSSDTKERLREAIRSCDGGWRECLSDELLAVLRGAESERFASTVLCELVPVCVREAGYAISWLSIRIAFRSMRLNRDDSRIEFATRMLHSVERLSAEAGRLLRTGDMREAHLSLMSVFDQCARPASRFLPRTGSTWCTYKKTERPSAGAYVTLLPI